MKQRSGYKVMLSLIKLVKPLTLYMILAILMGLIGHLCASFITILGGYAILDVLNFNIGINLSTIFIIILLCALFRGVFRYIEQSCNHYIAFKLLALLRDKVFVALRKLCPAKLEGRDKGNLIAVITSDIELLEVFYAHTISPIVIALLFSIIMIGFIGSYHWLLGIIAFMAYLFIGLIIPLIISKLNGNDGLKFRTKSGNLSSFVLDSLRGLSEILQYNNSQKRLLDMDEYTDELIVEEEKIISFIKEKDTYLEIGPGRGQFILSMASKFPNYNFLVIELDKSIAGTALKKIDEANLTNVRLIAGDFYKLSKILKKDLFCGVFLNFSDPWPKKRHEKRRLTSPNFLVEYSKILKEGACIFYKTDNDLFYEYSLEKFKEYKWEIIYQNEDYESASENFDALTEFENRYKSAGIKIKRLILKNTKDTIKEVIKEEGE